MKTQYNNISAEITALVESGETHLEPLYKAPPACADVAPNILPDGFPVLEEAQSKMVYVLNDDTFKHLKFRDNDVAVYIRDIDGNISESMSQYLEFVYSPYLPEGIIHIPEGAFWVTQLYNEIVFAMYKTRRENDPWIGCC